MTPNDTENWNFHEGLAPIEGTKGNIKEHKFQFLNRVRHGFHELTRIGFSHKKAQKTQRVFNLGLTQINTDENVEMGNIEHPTPNFEH